MTTKDIGPFNRGMDNVSTDENMPKSNDGHVDVARDALNIDFTREGWWDTRPGLSPFLDGDYHSSYTTIDGRTYAAAGKILYSFDVRDGTRTAIFTLPTDAPLCFDDLHGDTVFSSRDYLGLIDTNNAVASLCIPDGMMPHVAPTVGSGGLPAGRYSFGLSFVDPRGKEGGLSVIGTRQVAQGGGLRFTLPAAPAGIVLCRLYLTGTNGDKLYKAAEVPLALGTYLLGSGTLGKECTVRDLRAMPPGDYVRAWMGRLLTMKGRTLRLSEPLAYHLHSPRFGFVQFERPGAFIEGVEGGIYVGMAGDTVIFLRGTMPKDFVRVRTGGNPPAPGSSLKISNDLLDPQLQISGECALWLATNGYVLGRNDGSLTEPQAQRIRLPVPASGRTAVINRRVVTIVNA